MQMMRKGQHAWSTIIYAVVEANFKIKLPLNKNFNFPYSNETLRARFLDKSTST